MVVGQTRIGWFDSSNSSEQSKAESSVSTSTRSRLTDSGDVSCGNQMTSYLEYVALPEVQLYLETDKSIATRTSPTLSS